MANLESSRKSFSQVGLQKIIMNEQRETKRGMSLLKLSLYVFFLTFPFLKTIVFRELALPEIPLYFSALLIVLIIVKKQIKWQMLDTSVILYGCANFLSVIVGMDNSFDSLRHFRWFVFFPLVIYFVVRFSPLSLEEFAKAAYFLIPGVLLQEVIIVSRFISDFGERQPGREGILSSVTLSLLVVFTITLLLFLNKSVRMGKGLRWLIVFLSLISLFVTYQRSTSAIFLILLISGPLIWKSKKRVFVTLSVMVFFIIAIIFIVLSNFPLPNNVIISDYRERRTTVERLYSLDIYYFDLIERVALWQDSTFFVVRRAPVFGMGLDSLAVTWEESSLGQFGSAHNLLVTAFRQGGVITLGTLLFLIVSAFILLGNIMFNSSSLIKMKWGKVIYINLLILLFVAIVNDLSAGRAPYFFLILAMLSAIHDA